MSLSFKNDSVQLQEYVYDFSVDGGLVSTIDLSAKSAPLPLGAIVKKVTKKVLTTFTSGGAATVAWGNTTDLDGYSGPAIAVGSLTLNAVFNGNEAAATPGALLWETIATTPNAVKEKPGASVLVANDAIFSITIATAALTAGKAVYIVEYYVPAAS